MENPRPLIKRIDMALHIQEICATMYRGLGIDTMSTTLLDNTGRPQYLLDHREPLKELI